MILCPFLSGPPTDRIPPIQSILPTPVWSSEAQEPQSFGWVLKGHLNEEGVPGMPQDLAHTAWVGVGGLTWPYLGAASLSASQSTSQPTCPAPCSVPVTWALSLSGCRGQDGVGTSRELQQRMQATPRDLNKVPHGSPAGDGSGTGGGGDGRWGRGMAGEREGSREGVKDGSPGHQC